MNRFCKFMPHMMAALIGAAMLVVPNQARAAFAVRITDSVTGPGGVTIMDNAAGDIDGRSGFMNVNYNDSAYSVIGTFSFTNAPGTASLGILDSNYSLNTFGSTGGAAKLEVSSTGVTAPSGNPLTFQSLLNGNGSGSGTLSAASSITSSQTLFDTTPGNTVSTGPFNINGSYSGSGNASYTLGTPYTITNVLTFNLSRDSTTTGDLQSTVAAPAPAGLVLALTGLPALGAWARRRRAAA